MFAEVRFDIIALLLRVALSGSPRFLKITNMESRSLIKDPIKCARVTFQRSLVISLHSRKMQTVQNDVYKSEVSTFMCNSDTDDIPRWLTVL